MKYEFVPYAVQNISILRPSENISSIDTDLKLTDKGDDPQIYVAENTASSLRLIRIDPE
jgi:hypothetical protein